MRPNRGSFNRKTGKTTPRTKGKTHWGGSKKAAVGLKKPSKPAASKPSAPKKK